MRTGHDLSRHCGCKANRLVAMRTAQERLAHQITSGLKIESSNPAPIVICSHDGDKRRN
jgi:hypothetical protein